MITVGNIYAGLNSTSSGGVMTLNNGLTLTGTNGQLGGALVQNTAITAGGFTFSIDTLNLNQLIVTSTTVASRPFPSMTAGQRAAIAGPEGYFVYDLTAHQPYFYNNAATWKPLITTPTGADTSHFMTSVGSLGTVNNGVVMAGGTIGLGGSLNVNTTISLLGFGLNLSGPTSAFTTFRDMQILFGLGGGLGNASSVDVNIEPFGSGGVTIEGYNATSQNFGIIVDNGQFIVINSTTGGAGIQDSADYSGNWNTLNYITLGYSQANFQSKGNTRTSANFGQTASLANAGSLAVGGSDATFRVGAWLNIDTITGTANITITIAWTDPNNTARTKNFFDQGAVSSLISTADYYAFPTRDMRCKAGTTVQLSTTVGGVGTILYEIGAEITNILGF